MDAAIGAKDVVSIGFGTTPQPNGGGASSHVMAAGLANPSAAARADPCIGAELLPARRFR
jgi:hypothetical protein